MKFEPLYARQLHPYGKSVVTLIIVVTSHIQSKSQGVWDCCTVCFNKSQMDADNTCDSGTEPQTIMDHLCCPLLEQKCTPYDLVGYQHDQENVFNHGFISRIVDVLFCEYYGHDLMRGKG